MREDLDNTAQINIHQATRNLAESVIEMLYSEDCLIIEKIRRLLSICCNTLDKLQYVNDVNIISNVKESVRYLHTRLKWCFSELLCVIEAPVPLESEEAEDCGGIFVQRMDQALEILASMKVDEEFHDLIPVVKEVVEDLLCHAMAIAQVLHCLENIKKELPSASVHTSIRQSLSFALADALETLEQQVNNGVLRLVLEVFYDPCSPLKELLKKLALSSVDPQAEDLDNQIVVLDLHVDRIMQIGMFAMACSSDVKRILGIRSCLASLESLEPELVPAITAHYIDYNQSTHRNYVKMLSCHWQKEVIDLEKLIDGIVDPAAFCQIIYEDVHGLVVKLKSSLNSEKHTLKSLVDKVCKKSSKLVRHLLISVPEMEPLATELSIPHAIEELNRETLLFPNSVKDLPLDISHSNTEDGRNSEGDFGMKSLNLGNIQLNKGLQPFFEKGKKLCQERSILYQTPKSAKKPCLKLSAVYNSQQNVVPRRLFTRDDSIKDKDDTSLFTDNTLGLEITEILDRLTFLSDTLSLGNGSYVQ
ncbi:hypothetical protein C0J52_15113 [Blattella germanica]|nr:hypothetical protein C0J52_15113 [Blattella germanica]